MAEFLGFVCVVALSFAPFAWAVTHSRAKESLLRWFVLVGSVCVLTGLLASPTSASAQAGDEGGSRLERWHPEAFVDPTAPALQLELPPAGFDVEPISPRTVDGYTRDEVELRVRRAKIGVGLSAVALAAGSSMVGGGMVSSICFSFGDADPCPPPASWVAPVSVGSVLVVGGLVTIIVSSVALRRRKRDRDSLSQANGGAPHRARWDLAQSRLVF